MMDLRRKNTFRHIERNQELVKCPCYYPVNNGTKVVDLHCSNEGLLSIIQTKYITKFGTEILFLE